MKQLTHSHTIHLVFRIVSSSLKKAKTMKLIKDNPSIGTTLPKRQRKNEHMGS